MSEKKMKRTFSPQFRTEAVQLVVTSGRPIKHVADELGITDQTLGSSSILGGFSFDFSFATRRIEFRKKPLGGTGGI